MDKYKLLINEKILNEDFETIAKAVERAKEITENYNFQSIKFIISKAGVEVFKFRFRKIVQTSVEIFPY